MADKKQDQKRIRLLESALKMACKDAITLVLLRQSKKVSEETFQELIKERAWFYELKVKDKPSDFLNSSCEDELIDLVVEE